MDFVVATFNANSVRARMPIILRFLEERPPDVLCLQETKVRDAEFPREPFEEAGYHVVFRGRKAHAGVAIAARRPPEDVSFGLDDGEEPDEARLIRATCDGVPVVNTYVPQGRSIDSEHFRYKLRWLGRMRGYFERHFPPEEPLIWCGDLNVAPTPLDVHDPKRLIDHVDFHPDVREAFASVVEWGFVDVFRKHHPEGGRYTYYDYRVRGAVERGIGWRVDHILATEPLAARCVDSFIDVEYRLMERPSDHTYLVAVFSL